MVNAIYMNGNTKITINLETGTKIRETMDNEFIPEFAESMDICITKKCTCSNCAYCYEGCSAEGQHGNLNYEFLNHLHPYTEVAINGNDLTHPGLIPFLQKLRDQKVICNMTVNQVHFEMHCGFIAQLINAGLIKGLGVSLVNPTEDFIFRVKRFPNAVIHVINGIFDKSDYEALKGNDLKILILGYKNMRRGETYLLSHTEEVAGNQQWLYDNLANILDGFKVVCFDNLSLEQLEVKRLLSDEEWERFYNGNDGLISFYLDLVDGTFSKSSTTSLEQRYPIEDFTVDEMFDVIRKESGYIKEK